MGRLKYGLTFGEVMKDLRKKQGLTQKELAKRVGVSVRTIQHYEADDIKPRIIVLEKICDVLDWRGPVEIEKSKEVRRQIRGEVIDDERAVDFAQGYRYPVDVSRIFKTVNFLKELIDLSDSSSIRQNIYTEINNILYSLHNFQQDLIEIKSNDDFRKNYIQLKSQTIGKILDYLEILLTNIYRGISEKEED